MKMKNMVMLMFLEMRTGSRSFEVTLSQELIKQEASQSKELFNHMDIVTIDPFWRPFLQSSLCFTCEKLHIFGNSAHASFHRLLCNSVLILNILNLYPHETMKPQTEPNFQTFQHVVAHWLVAPGCWLVYAPILTGVNAQSHETNIYLLCTATISGCS